MTSAGDLVRDLDLVNEILEDLDLSEDEILNEQLAEISIELDGVLVDHDAVAERTRLLLSEIHCQNITAKLEAVVQSALGYYSLADQPEGTNEPPIGPQSAIQLLNKSYSCRTCDSHTHIYIYIYIYIYIHIIYLCICMHV